MVDITQSLLFAGELSTSIAQFLDIYGIAAIFISTVFFGEIAILVGFILSGQAIFLFETVFIFSVLGTISADLFWYMVGRFFPKKFLTKGIHLKILHPLSSLLGYLTKDRLFLSLLFVKFLIGTRLVTIIYLARQKVPFHLFVIFDVLGTILFVAVLSIIGWFVGKGLYNLLPVYHIITSIILIILLAVALTYIFRIFKSYFRKFLYNF